MSARESLHIRSVVVTVLLLAGTGHMPSASAQFRELFEAAETTWQLADRDCTVQVIQHARGFDVVHSGQASEVIETQLGQGTFVHWKHSVPPSRVIDEWTARIWVKADHPGIQFLARVVLPRSKDPRTGGPIRTMLPGSIYAQTGAWQMLEIATPARLLRQHLPRLRAQFGSMVSDREAYIDLLVMNTYGGPGHNQLYVDDLEITGLVASAPNPNGSSPPEPTVAGSASAAAAAEAPARLEGKTLIVGTRPQLVRAIQYQGESFEFLRQLGFNTIWMPMPPTTEQCQEAAQQGLFLIAPAPVGRLPAAADAVPDTIICWDLGTADSDVDPEPLRQRAQRLRSVPLDAQRPLICTAAAGLWSVSRIADVLVLPTPPLNGSLPLAGLGAWYRRHLESARMETPFWSSIPTQIAPEICSQVRALGAELPVPLCLEPEQIRLAVYHAIASGAHGLLFRSRTRLDGPDRMTAMRAKSLQWVNLELKLLEPWAAAGSYAGEIDTGNPNLRAAGLQVQRSRLLIIIARAPDQQYVVGPAGATTAAFDIFGIPDSDEVYHVSTDGMTRLAQQRAAGLRVTFDAQQQVSLILVTQDSLAINYLARQIQQQQETNDLLMGELAAAMYGAVVETRQRLVAIDPSGVSSAGDLETVRRELQHFQRLAENHGPDQARSFLQQGLDHLAAIRVGDWRRAVRSFPSPVASPLCVSYFLIPEHYALGQRLQGLHWQPNSLAGGDFESLELLQGSGWQNTQSTDTAVNATVDLSLDQPHGGRACLRLSGTANGRQAVGASTENPCVRIVSAPVPIRPGQLVRIHGWVRIDQPISHANDGMFIHDSLGGRALGQRLYQTNGWQEFSLFRAAARDTTVRLSFELWGPGQVKIDDVTIATLQPPGA